MRKITKLLACIDFSEYSKETLEYAMALAPEKATITLLNVINSRDLSAVRSVSAYFPDPNVVEQFVEKNREIRLKNMKRLIEENFRPYADKCTILIKVGVPFEEILDTVVKDNIDLVVMGGKGRSNLARTLFGSNAEKVFRHSPVPVLSVRNRASASPRLDEQA